MERTCEDGEQAYAAITFKQLCESGAIQLEGVEGAHPVLKDKGISGWSILPAGADVDVSDHPEAIAMASRIHGKRTSLDVKLGGERFIVSRTSFLKNSYTIRALPDDREVDKDEDVSVLGEEVGTVQLNGFFKSSLESSFHEGVPILLPALCCWLISILDKQEKTRTGVGGAIGAGAI